MLHLFLHILVIHDVVTYFRSSSSGVIVREPGSGVSLIPSNAKVRIKQETTKTNADKSSLLGKLKE